ncbi:hypothetical protein T484DRAFT_1965446 [Baffinella frigidus]|nr:hypothetical protein T484DRAFT_1965446 [Cryptophyta sp. CCMP2293]
MRAGTQSTMRSSAQMTNRTPTVGQRAAVGITIMSLNVRSTYISASIKTGVPASEGGLSAQMAREVGDFILASGATVACLQNLNLHTKEFETISGRLGNQWEAACSHDTSRETTPGVMSGLAVFSKLPFRSISLLDSDGVVESHGRPESQGSQKWEDAARLSTGGGEGGRDVKSNALGQTVPRVETVKFAPRRDTKRTPSTLAARCAMVCGIEVPGELQQEQSTLWIVNMQLDESSEASRVHQFASLTSAVRRAHPAALTSGHVLCGGLSSLARGDYSDGAWLWLEQTARLMRQGGETAPNPSAVLMTSLLDASNPDRYRDTRAAAGWETVFEDGARVESTTSWDTREDYILLSSKLAWTLAPGSFNIYAHPPGLPLSNNGVVCSLVPQRRGGQESARLGGTARSNDWGAATGSWAELSLRTAGGSRAPLLDSRSMAQTSLGGSAGSSGFRGFVYKEGGMVVPVGGATGAGTTHKFSKIVTPRRA